MFDPSEAKELAEVIVDELTAIQKECDLRPAISLNKETADKLNGLIGELRRAVEK